MEQYKDLVTRAAWTFIQTFLSVWVVGGALDFNPDAIELAALSGGAAALSVIKSFAARQLEGGADGA